MIVLKVKFNISEKYNYKTINNEIGKVLGQISVKYDLSNIVSKFGIMRSAEHDSVIRFRNVLAFYSFLIKLNGQKVIYEIENTRFVTKEMDKVVECFRNFWD